MAFSRKCVVSAIPGSEACLDSEQGGDSVSSRFWSECLPHNGWAVLWLRAACSAKSLGLGLSGEFSLLAADENLPFASLAHMRGHLNPCGIHRFE